MLVAAGNAQLKAKLHDKSRWRPTAMIMKKMPDGTRDLAELPRRRVDAPIGDEAADEEFCQAVARVASTFGKQKRSSSTVAEHVMYMRLFDGWLLENKHGSVVEADESSRSISGKNWLPRKVTLVPRRRADGSIKVRAKRCEPRAIERVLCACEYCGCAMGSQSGVWIGAHIQ